MRVKFWWKHPVLVPALVLAALPAFAQQQEASQQPAGESVAEAARKAREQKKTAPKPKKIITEDDLGRPAAAPTGAPATEGAATAEQGAEGGAPSAGQKNDEAAWRGRFKSARDAIARAEKELDILQRGLEKGQVQYYPDPQKAMQEQYSRKDINEKTTKIEAKKKEIAQLKQKLSDLEDELRKAGGDPGWARE